MKYLSILAMFAFSATVLYIAIPEFNKQHDNYIAEGKCISTLINAGIERSQIKPVNGECHLR